MSTPDFAAIVAKHRNYFRSGATRPVEWRPESARQRLAGCRDKRPEIAAIAR